MAKTCENAGERIFSLENGSLEKKDLWIFCLNIVSEFLSAQLHLVHLKANVSPYTTLLRTPEVFFAEFNQFRERTFEMTQNSSFQLLKG